MRYTPGGVATNIWTGAPWYGKPRIAIAKLFMDTPEEGGDRIVYLAESDKVEGKTGGYYERNRLTEPTELARDAAVGKKLWQKSEELTKAR